MYNVLVAGAGKIGTLISCLLAGTNDYQVHIVDVDFNNYLQLVNNNPIQSKIKKEAIDIKDNAALQNYISKHGITIVISSLPYFLNSYVANAAKNRAHYFDLTEDIAMTTEIKSIALDSDTVFVPQCGLAPGMISIIASSLLEQFEQCFNAKLCVGALPQNSSNSLHYALNWSTDGLINEYGRLCHAIEHNKPVLLNPLEGLELIQIDGCAYEIFNTSGGIGSLAEIYQDKILNLTYKTIRYPGHCEKMRFLMNELQLNQDRATLKKILERVLPKTNQDKVIIYVSVEGYINGSLVEKNYLKKIYPKIIADLPWSAIQISTAAGVCSVVDLVMQNIKDLRGFVMQENFKFKDILNNRFGSYYA